MNKKCRMGIIGAGRIGKLHAANLKTQLPQFELNAIADPQLDTHWAKTLDIPLLSTSVEDILDNQDIDAVLIASPSHLHSQQILRACESGKAIFCEKPLGLSEQEILQTIEAVNKNNTLLQVGFNRRFDPSFSNLQNRIKTGEIGQTQLICITSRDPACPSKEYCATSGGIFMDMSIHDFDMARFLANSEVVEVYAAGAVLINPEFEAFNDVDTATIQLRFANGTLGIINNSRQAVYGYDQRIEVLGSEGMLLAGNQPSHQVVSYGMNGIHSANPLYFFLERYQQAFITELTAFYQSWISEKPALVSTFDGLQALRIAQAAKQSLEINAPVKL
ncbi:myo-inositol-2-dehydrogenase [Legionella quinlivanii]|uniref:Myo-inositol-2-dehydrogenase n=1 Tax=Legionella quinlivanii TaxID=45073 RepID=A0A0W0XYX3_9GAMM|nr:inositol 2-dehydrogenase [Legionella quinlivanii]KTD49944.1 myo-inositol-2-dehydrogenase [Legionella quinlivanii]MCW8450539.1 inositol 2-dehydrogenase [Legionella quinlivanii]SEF97112.1 myo-inositol 2-dehydrogenase [Legionella quinlivanii DSM 21216]STY11280.1 myo-inositol 2-dehydrogenase [Legionella quinlivanii]